jgi:type II secretory pathway pseudopilin PulG
LLVFLGLAGLLSATGMYGLARYLRHTKTAEALGSVTTMAAAAADSYNNSDFTQPAGTEATAARAMRHFPPSSKQSVPADAIDVRGKQFQSNAADWSVSPWRDMRFSIPQPQYYVYSFRAEGVGPTANATAIAQGDLDADGEVSRFTLDIKPDPDAKAKVADQVMRENSEE